MNQLIADYEKRPIIYGVLLAAGFVFLANVREIAPDRYYFVWAAIVYLFVLLELFITANHFHIERRKNSKVLYDFEKHRFVQYTHHVALPSVLYFGFAFFLYFNNLTSSYILIIALTGIVFSILFENIYAFYKHQFSLHQSTNYVYDLISVIAVFLWADVIVNFSRAVLLKEYLLIILMTVVIGFISALMLLRHTFDRAQTFVLITILIVNAWVVLGLSTLGTAPISIAFILTLIHAGHIYFINQSLSGKVTWKIAADFGVVLMLVFALMSLYGI